MSLEHERNETPLEEARRKWGAQRAEAGPVWRRGLESHAGHGGAKPQVFIP
ncbi:hypothetical protein [uncultured Fretibacterium sp.]|uniref:hypothetical protein n=1 Tax=uncultured Fretibacterium sp. TaxID=1678694 RepID=UPI00262D2D76|nr:hypothetical protein [uncultured Fretibacterium sp.]